MKQIPCSRPTYISRHRKIFSRLATLHPRFVHPCFMVLKR